MKMMKKLMTSVFCLAAVLMTFIGLGTTAKAAEPTTYYVAYVSTLGEYRYYNQPWDGNAEVHHLSINNLEFDMKDGDNLVVYTTALKFEKTIDKKLGELTIAGYGTAVLTAKSFDKVFVIKNTTVAVNGDVTDAYVYDNGIANFNNNVGTLHLIEDAQKTQNVYVLGTVDCVSESKTGNTATNDYYAFKKGACVIKNGGMYALDGTYSRDPGAVNKPQTETGNTGKPAAGSSDLDDVPKTGDESVSVGIYLILMSAVCAAGCVVMRRKRV